jgi:ATP-dependent RNA helicase SUPV3L1/SUV3
LLLWALQLKKSGALDIANLPMPPGQGLTSAVFDATTPVGFYGVCGYRICGPRVVRIDMLERLADIVRERVFWKARFPDDVRPAGSVDGGGFTIVADMMSLVGCSGEVFEGILKNLGFRNQKKKIRRAPATVATPPVAPELPPVAEIAAVDVEAVMPAEVVPVQAIEPPTEEIEIDVWWPKDTGPFRHKPEAKKPENQKPRRPERKSREPERKPRREEPPRKPEKPMDPNSPFAALAALRAKMTGN